MNKKRIIIFSSIIFLTSLLGGIFGNVIKTNVLNKYEVPSNSGSLISKGEKKEEKKEYVNDYILVHGLPIGNSGKIKNSLVALINKNLGTINLFPYNYFTKIKGKERLSNLNKKELESFFKEKGIKVEKEIFIDQEDIFNIYNNLVQNLEKDENPYMEIKGKDGKINKIKIGNKTQFYKLIESNLLDENKIEQIFYYILNNINNKEIKSIIKENKENNFYKTPYKLTLTEKNDIFDSFIVNKVKVKVDPYYNYLSTLKTGKFNEFKKKKLTLKEKMKIKRFK